MFIRIIHQFNLVIILNCLHFILIIKALFKFHHEVIFPNFIFLLKFKVIIQIFQYLFLTIKFNSIIFNLIHFLQKLFIIYIQL